MKVKNVPGCCSCGTCPTLDELPDWTIDGFTSGDWFQYGECCWSRTYTRINMSAGVQYHFQDLYKRSFLGSVSRDFYGWWVRQNWRPNGPPPVGSLFPTPMPNTCWNPYGLVGTVTHTSEFEQNARQEVAFQITSVFVTIQEVYNTCTEEVEYYVRVQTTVRSSNQINTISYTRHEMTASLDTCYELNYGIAPFVNTTGTKTFSTLLPSWTSTVIPNSLYKYDSLEDIPDTLVVDIAESPVETISEACWDSHPCRPYAPLPLLLCHGLNPPFYVTPPAYIFDATIVTQTDACLLSTIQLNTGDLWSTCTTIHPGVIPHPLGDMSVIFCTILCGIPGTGTNPCGTSGFGAANSSVISCPVLTYDVIQSGVSDTVGIHIVDSRVIVRRKDSCSPLDLIPCDPYIDWWAGGKTYPVTQSYRALTHTKSRNVYSPAPLCMNPTTFSLVS